VEGLEGEEAVEVVTGAWVEKGSRGRRRAAKEGLWEEERRKRGMARLREREREGTCVQTVMLMTAEVELDEVLINPFPRRFASSILER